MPSIFGVERDNVRLFDLGVLAPVNIIIAEIGLGSTAPATDGWPKLHGAGEHIGH